MRRSHTETGWIYAEDKSLVGISLGYDHCAEHEWGAKAIKRNLGIKQDNNHLGIETRKMTINCDDVIHLVEYKSKTIPHALMYLSDDAKYWNAPPKSKTELASRLSCSLYDTKLRSYKPEIDDIAISWDGSDGFAIHVRGKENVAFLKKLHSSFLDKDIALMDASSAGFLRKALALVIPSTTPEFLKEKLLNEDISHNKLLQYAKDSGIEKILEEAGCGFYALAPGYRGNIESIENLQFFLNPKDQKKFAFGWFNVDELIQWTQNKGPIVDGISAKEALKDKFGPDASFNIIKKSNEVGLNFNNATAIWMDESHTTPGYRINWSKNNDIQMADGYYSTEQLETIFNDVEDVRLTDKSNIDTQRMRS